MGTNPTFERNVQLKLERSKRLFATDSNKINEISAMFALPPGSEYDKLDKFSEVNRTHGLWKHHLAALYHSTRVTEDSQVLKGFTAPFDPSSYEQVREQIRLAMSREHKGCPIYADATAIVLSYRHTSPEERKRRPGMDDARLNDENIELLIQQIIEFGFPRRKLQIWIDQIYGANRSTEANIWSNEAIVPYAMLPVFYYHNTEGDEKVTKDRTWLAMERELGISGAGYYFLDKTRTDVAWFSARYKNVNRNSHGHRLHIDDAFREGSINLLSYVESTETYWREDLTRLKTLALNATEYGLSAILCEKTDIRVFYGMRTARALAMRASWRSMLNFARTCGEHLQLRCNGRVVRKEQYLMASGANWDGILEWTHPDVTNDIDYGIMFCCDRSSYFQQCARTLTVHLHESHEDQRAHCKLYLHVMINNCLQPFRAMICKVLESKATEPQFQEGYVLSESDFVQCMQTMDKVAPALRFAREAFAHPHRFWLEGPMLSYYHVWTAVTPDIQLCNSFCSLVNSMYAVRLLGTGTIGMYSDEW